MIHVLARSLVFSACELLNDLATHPPTLYQCTITNWNTAHTYELHHDCSYCLAANRVYTKNVIVVRWRRVVYVACASGDGTTRAEPEWVYEPEAMSTAT